MSSSVALRLARHLCTTTTTTTTTTTSTASPVVGPIISISKAKSKLRSEFDPDKALQIYSSLSHRNKSPGSSRYAQDLTIQRLAKSHRFDDIEALLEAQKKDPKITQEPFLCNLIRSYGRAGMFEHALRTYTQMEELGTPKTTLSFNALLAACNNARLFERAHQLFDEMRERYGVVPDKVSHGILTKAYCELGNPEKGLEILEEMERKGVEVTAVTFTTILDALYRKGKVEEADKLWDEMVKKGCVIDVTAYNVRIAHAHGGQPEDVKGLIEEMTGIGLKPDSISYNYLLTSYCRNGRMDEAMRLYEELEASGFNPKAATFRTLIYYLCKKGDFGTGYDVFKKSVFYHKIPDFATLKILVEGLVAKKKVKDAKGLIRTVKKRFPPNVLNAWKKVEVDLGLVSQESSPDESDEEEEAAA